MTIAIYDKRPAEEPRELTISISPVVDPYWVEFYETRKKDNESMECFAARHLSAMIVGQRAESMAKQLEEGLRGNVQVIKNDLSTFMIENALT